MTRIVWIGLALLSAWLYAPELAQAQTCEPRTNVPSYEVGKPAPIICDEHGSQHVKIVDADGNVFPEAVATEAAPTLQEGSRASLSLDLAGNLRMTQGTQAGGEHVGEGEVEELGYMRTVGGKARSYALMTDVLTDTSSATTTLPSGGKTFFAKIVGSVGAQSVTVTIYGDYKSTATEEFLVCTLTLSGTSEDAKKCTGISEDYDYYHAKTASISGTDATVNVWAMLGLGGGSAGSGGEVTNAGTFATQVDGAALTALQLIDDDQTGTSNNYKTSAGTTEDETEIKATAGRLMGIQITNTNAAARYFRCANLTAANTTPGTSTVFYGIAVPGATTGDGLVINFGPSGLAFSTALTCWVVTGVADTDVAEVAANEIKWNIQYK